MDKLVDTAVGLVEEGRLQQATQVLQQGIDLLTSTFPDRWVTEYGVRALVVGCRQQMLPSDRCSSSSSSSSSSSRA
jgi:hypothetical protein